MTKKFQKFKIETINKNTLVFYSKFLIKILNFYNINFKYFFLPKKKKKYTFLKSPHVHKKSKEHFVLIKYRIFFKIYENKKIFNRFLFLYKPNSIKLKLIAKGR